MTKEIKFKIKVDSEKELNKVNELIIAYIANLEMAGSIKMINFKRSQKNKLWRNIFKKKGE